MLVISVEFKKNLFSEGKNCDDWEDFFSNFRSNILLFASVAFKQFDPYLNYLIINIDCVYYYESHSN